MDPKHIAKMQAGRRRATKREKAERPRQLKETEKRMNDLGKEIDKLTRKGEDVPRAMRDDLRALGFKRLDLKWSE